MSRLSRRRRRLIIGQQFASFPLADCRPDQEICLPWTSPKDDICGPRVDLGALIRRRKEQPKEEEQQAVHLLVAAILADLKEST